MKTNKILLLMVLSVLVPSSMPLIHSHSLMGGLGGLKGHNRGHGAVELLLATGILAKLLNHRAKHGASMAGRHILNALLGGHRYPPQHHSRFNPLDMQSLHPAILQDDLLDTHSMAALSMPMNEADLLMNQESALLGIRSPMLMGQESALLGSRAPMLMGPSMDTSSLLAAEAQLSQQLLAARRARRLMEARKMLAAQVTTHFLTAQSEVNNILAAQEAMHNHGFLSADQSRQVFTSIAPPRSMPQRNPGHPLLFSNNLGQSTGNLMGSHTPPQYQGMNNLVQQNSGPQGNFHGNAGQSGNGMMGSESVQQPQTVMYSQPSPVYPGPSQPSPSSSEGNYHSSSLHQGNFQGGSQPQGYSKQGNYRGAGDLQQGNYRGTGDLQQGNYRGTGEHQQGTQQGNYNSGYSARQGNSYGSRISSNSAQKKNSFVTPEMTRQLQASGRSEEEYTIPSDVDMKDAAKIVAGLQGML